MFSGKYTKTNMIVYLEYSWKRWSYASRYHYPLLSFCISILCNQSISHKHNSILLHQHEILKKSYVVKLYKTEIPIFFTSHCCNQYCRLNWWLIKRKTMHACICIFKFLSTSILLASNECIAIIGLQNNDKHTLWIKKWSCLIILAKEIPHFILDLT